MHPEYNKELIQPKVWWGACAMQGWRETQEDAHICEMVNLLDGSNAMLFAVFDGHGGTFVS